MHHSSLPELFPDADFAFSMRLQSGDPAEFFRPTAGAAEILAERCRWLDAAPGCHLCALAAADRLTDGLRRFAVSISTHQPGIERRGGSISELLDRLGRVWEPDLLIVEPNAAGEFILVAGCVCFPSGWALEARLGLPLDQIHGVVPGLNAAIAGRIQILLSRMKSGSGWFRSNWGISSSAELNQHPARALNRMTADTPPHSTWLRVEHQVLTPLPGSKAILFGIRLENVPLKTIRADQRLAKGLRRALATMPDALARYKNLSRIRSALVAYLA